MARALVPAALAGALLVTAAVFYLDPSIDLDVAGAFYRGRNQFIGQVPAGEALRRVFYWIPTAILTVCAGLLLARRLGSPVGWTPTGRGLVFLVSGLVLGPGLLANTVLKDHSHRPRPSQTLNFGGDDAFRPFYTFDGDCARNCSFVSGEGAAAAWTLAPALLTPPAIRIAAVALSIVFAGAAGALRMAFGGHYLSDTIFAVLLVWSVVWVLWRIIGPRRGDRVRPSA